VMRELKEAATVAFCAGAGVVMTIPEAIADALKNQRREILKHVNRMFQHAAMKSSTAHDDLSVRNLHKRLVQVEAELRRLTRSRSP
jgi:hypothetical protein